MKHLDITIKGRVQGVGFRAWAKYVADQQGVTGTVKNESNGDVTIAAEGDDLSIELFLDECNTGCDYCTVTSVESNEGELKNYRNFVIIK